jgi:Uma2 family endonuclease
MATAESIRVLPASAPLASPEVYRMTVDEYERMAGVLNDPRVELIDGYLVRKTGKKPPRAWAVGNILEAIVALLPNGWTWRKEDPVRIPEFDEPEPDVTVVRGSRDDYRDRHPEAGDVTIIVEVSESTLDRDRGKKLLAYAKGGVATYWIVNLVDGQLEVYTRPDPDGYQSSQILKPGQDVSVVIDGVEVGRIAVSDILPYR